MPAVLCLTGLWHSAGRRDAARLHSQFYVFQRQHYASGGLDESGVCLAALIGDNRPPCCEFSMHPPCLLPRCRDAGIRRPAPGHHSHAAATGGDIPRGSTPDAACDPVQQPLQLPDARRHSRRHASAGHRGTFPVFAARASRGCWTLACHWRRVWIRGRGRREGAFLLSFQGLACAPRKRTGRLAGIAISCLAPSLLVVAPL